jgi:membrane protein YqaA with SNARE-associated domain
MPLINVEIFVLALVSREAGLHWPHCLALGAVVALGQVAGKLLYFLAARGSLHLPSFMHRRPRQAKPLTPRRMRWHQRTKRMRGWVGALTEKCHQHPHWMTGTYGVSAIVGLPPFMATTVLAGLARMPMSIFLGAGFAGRFIRFSVLAASPALLTGWLL